MIPVQCKCGRAFEVADALAGLTAECPACGADAAVPFPGQGEELALNTRDYTPREVTVIAEPIPEDVPTVGYASADTERTLQDAMTGPRPETFGDTIRPPRVRFARDVFAGFGALFAGPNRRMLPTLAGLNLLLATPVALGPLGVWFWPFLGFVPLGLQLALGFRACQAACAGFDDEKLLAIQDGVWEDIIRPLLWLLGTLWVSLIPLWIYYGVLYAARLPRVPLIEIELLLVSLFVWPATVLTLVMGESLSDLTPANVGRMIVGAFVPYVIVWTVVAIVAMAGVGIAHLASRTVSASSAGQFCPMIGVWVLLTGLGATGLLVMRTIGLLYRHYKAQLPFAAE